MTVHTADGGIEGAGLERRNGVEVRRHRGLSPAGAYHLAPGITPAVRRSDADIVHAHNYHAFPLLFAAIGVTNKLFVVTPHYHGVSANPIRERLLTAYHPLGGWGVRRADAVVAVSEWERDRLRETFGVDATVIPNGIAVERFGSAQAEERERPYLLYVGRLEEYKGVQYAIQTLVHLPDYELLIAGDGPYREVLERLAADICVIERVKFLGHVPDERLPSLFAGATVYVALSTVEAFGLTVGEALAAGTPCVVLEESGLADWTDHSGCVGIDDRTPEAVAEAIMGAADLQVSATDLLTWDEVTARVEAVYNRVLEREGAD